MTRLVQRRAPLHRCAGTALFIAATLAPAVLADCPPDCNGDSRLNVNDFICFQAKWRARAPYGDYDGSGTYTVNDFVRFQADFASTLAGGGCPASGTPAQLACNPLSMFPFAEFVQSFNAGSPVSVAVDPAEFPVLSGVTADVFIVAARSASQWAADPGLADVRGIAQAVTFSGTTTRDNTFALSGSAALAAGGPARIATGYDLVIDANRNARLDSGDLIDGAGDESGFSVALDLSAPGPLAVTSPADYTVAWPGLKLTRDEQRLYYPSAIASLGPRPLVVISHGNGHQYVWYDYLGFHLASHGFIVMAHQNDTVPGIETASDTTLFHTDAFLAGLDSIAGGALKGLVDSSRISWIGHSRGGEGVARALTKIRTGVYAPVNFSVDDLVCVSSMAPTNYLGKDTTDPGATTYHLLFGQADGDVCGCPDDFDRQSFCIYERATADRASTSIQGADHNDFNCCGFDDFSGPPGTEIGREEAQRVAKGIFLALHAHFAAGDEAAGEFLWRQYEALRPPGVAATTVVSHELKHGAGTSKFIIDDYQSESSSAVSSCGGAVVFTVANVAEGVLDDADSGFGWTAADPMNGMTRANAGETTRGVVFDWNSPSYYELAIPAGKRDSRGFTWLNLRACQGTRHPATTARLGDLGFSVTLRDGAGRTASINIGAYGGGVEEPYQRAGFGSGAGWQNEFETVRVRLADFRRDGSGLDLADVQAVRLEFGGAMGSPEGRMGIDDVYWSER